MEELILEVDLSALAQKIVSTDPKLRIEAVDSVRDMSRKSIKAREILSMLISALDNEQDSQIISRLTKLIGKLGDSTVILLLKKFLWHPDSRVVANTLEGLGFIYSLDIIPIILPFLNSPDNRVKANAAKALYALNPALALEKLSEMINADEVFFRDSGAYILAVIADARCQEMLIELILKEHDMEILKKSIFALCNRGDGYTVDKIERITAANPDHPQKKVLTEIVESINQRIKTHKSSIQNISSVSDLAKLTEIYNNGTNKEKEQVCLRLFEIGGENALPFLKKASNDEDTSIRYAAKKAINNIFSKLAQKNQQSGGFSFNKFQGPAQVPPAISGRGLKASDHQVKKEEKVDYSAIIGPKETPNDDKPKYIEEIDMAFLVLDLSNNNPARRAEAVSKLLYANKNSKGVKDAIKYLVERLYVESEPQVKSQILRVIGTLGGKTEIEVLRKFAAEETQEYRIRANALEGLGCIDEPEVFDIIVPYMSHSDNRIKANAVIAAWKRNPDSTFNAISDMIRSTNVAMRDSAAYGLLILKTQDQRIINLMLELFVRETTTDIILKLTQGLSILGNEQIMNDMEKMIPNASALKRPHIETIVQKLRQKFDSLKGINAHDIARDKSHEIREFDAQFEIYTTAHKNDAKPAPKKAEETVREKTGPEAPPLKYIEKDDGTMIVLKNIETHLFEFNHPDEKIRLNSILAIKHYLTYGLPHDYFNQVEMLLTLSLNDASLRVRRDAFDAYQLIQSHRAVIIKTPRTGVEGD